MHNRGLTLLEVLVVIVVIGILAALFIPCTGGIRPAKAAACQANMQQLYKLGTVYASTHKGEWPAATGEDLWLSFRKTAPPLIETDHAAILHCDVSEAELGPDETNYRGPVLPWKKLAAGDPLAADREGNHGEEYGGNVLFKDGSVREYGAGDPLWKKCREALSP